MEGAEVSGGNSAPAPAASAPTTFAEAFASDASPASDPSQQTQDATAAAQPAAADETSPQQSDERSPFIPRARFDEVVTARKQAEEQLQAWKEFEWAKTVDRQAIANATELSRKFNTDRLGFITELIAQAQNDPALGPQLRSMAARTLSQGRGQGQQAEMPAPDVEIRDAGGNVVGLTYSDKQLALRDQYQQAQWLAQVRQEFAPLQQTVKQVETERLQLAAKSTAETLVTELGALPGFTEHANEIKQVLGSMQLPNDDPETVKLAAYAAYARVVPAKREQARQVETQTATQHASSKLLDDMKRKAAASVSGNPSAATTAVPSKVTSFRDPSLQW